MKEPPTEFFPVTDPAPRQYPDLVALLRRVKTGSVRRVAETSAASICRWLLHDALRQDDFLLLLRDYLRQLLEAGFDIERVTVHVGTLHPQLLGFYWYFQRGDGIVDELKVHIDGYDAPRYRRSPLAGVIEHGRTFRADTADAALQARYPLLADLAAEGIREYCVLPLGTGKAYHNAITLGTVRESGFDASALADIVTTLELFALHVERQILRMVAENVLDTYIGPAAGRKVLSGSIRRGTDGGGNLGQRPARLLRAHRPVAKRGRAGGAERLLRVSHRVHHPAWRGGAEVHRRRPAGRVPLPARRW